MKGKYICIEGNLGAGKTTLANQLSKRLNASLVLESFLDNPFLEGLYADIPSSKLPTELFFLTERLEQINNLPKSSQRLVISDYHIEKTKLFAQVNLPTQEKKLFDRIYNHSIFQLPIPDAILFIEQSVEEAFERVNQRGRTIEANISLEYLQNLSDQYDSYLSSIPPTIKLLKINGNELRKNFEETYQSVQNFLTSNHIL